jgi:transcription-repair coupling factor (superfamily II helicase)
VGYGKTELAMRASFRVAEAGKQVALLVPTTVLAAQHYRTFTERLADYPIVVDMISRFRSPREQSDILHRAGAGKIDILIGTHRLLSDDVRFSDLGLVIIDEEQRFGVEHKERLKQMRATVDVLTLTATPIPRTLHMALMGLRDISNLTTPPLDRRAIYTEVCSPSDQRVRSAVLAEMNRGGQVFFVHNRVYDIESVADHVRSIVPEARVAVAHGQMSERRLEGTMLRFVRGDIDVLVCTTIIESGLDIPAANTMFVHEADRFGLAQLHQLRGRVGRYKHRAYCYLLLPRRRTVNRTAAKRLKAVEEFSDLGAGFQIAMRDLEIRGAGNILGPEQSGHIAAVGYELYCRLLEQAVRRLRGEKVDTPRDVHVEVGVDAYIPRSYVSSARQRMEVYRRLALCRAVGELSQLGRDLADAYGSIPPVVEALLTVAEIRILAGRLGIDRIILMPPDVIFTIAEPSLADRALAGAAGTVRLADEQTAHWRPPPNYLEHPTLLTVLRRLLQQAAQRL